MFINMIIRHNSVPLSYMFMFKSVLNSDIIILLNYEQLEKRYFKGIIKATSGLLVNSFWHNQPFRQYYCIAQSLVFCKILWSSCCLSVHPFFLFTFFSLHLCFFLIKNIVPWLLPPPPTLKDNVTENKELMIQNQTIHKKHKK